MPAYDYVCLHCAHRFETVHAITEEPKLPCPVCGGLTRRAVVAGASIITGTKPPPPDEEPASEEDSHLCGGFCALHHNFDWETDTDRQPTSPDTEPQDAPA